MEKKYTWEEETGEGTDETPPAMNRLRKHPDTGMWTLISLSGLLSYILNILHNRKVFLKRTMQNLKDTILYE